MCKLSITIGRSHDTYQNVQIKIVEIKLNAVKNYVTTI